MQRSGPRIAASSYSNTAPLIWSFIYGRDRGKVELILDNAPARSASLLADDKVDAALVPVIASQFIDDVEIFPGVCVGTKKSVKSVCLVTRNIGLDEVKSVSLDVSSRTSVVLTKLIFREFLGSEPNWLEGKPEIEKMLSTADAALLIGDPALTVSRTKYRVFDLAEVWNQYTGLGFIFAMWMTRSKAAALDAVEFALARDEGLAHVEDIALNYTSDIGIDKRSLIDYLLSNIVYTPDEKMLAGLDLYIKLAAKNGLTDGQRPLKYVADNNSPTAM